MLKQTKKVDLKSLLILHAGILIYSISAVFSKLAAGKELFSVSFFLFYGLSLFMLFLYALIWQQALRRFALGTAYANRAVAALWSLLFGAILFSEIITLRHLLGVVVILVGVVLVVSGDE